MRRVLSQGKIGEPLSFVQATWGKWKCGRLCWQVENVFWSMIDEAFHQGMEASILYQLLKDLTNIVGIPHKFVLLSTSNLITGQGANLLTMCTVWHANVMHNRKEVIFSCWENLSNPTQDNRVSGPLNMTNPPHTQVMDGWIGYCYTKVELLQLNITKNACN